jgi:hypothetical protein
MFAVWAKGKHPHDASLVAKFLDNERTEMEFQFVARAKVEHDLAKVEHDLATSHVRIGSREQESRVQAAAIRIRESHEAEQSARAEAQEQQRMDAEQLSAVYEYSYMPYSSSCRLLGAGVCGMEGSAGSKEAARC